MAHPTEAELRKLGQDILDLLVEQTLNEAESLERAWENHGGIDGTTGPRTMVREVDAYIRNVYGFLPDTFANFAEPRPESFDDAISQCVGATMVLVPSPEVIRAEGTSEVGGSVGVWPNPAYLTDAAGRYQVTVVQRVDAVKTEVAEWEGVAADAFNREYMNLFEHSLTYQNAGTLALAVALEANRKIFDHAGQDILLIGAKTMDALRHVTDKDAKDYAVPLAVGAAVASVLSAGMAAPAAAVAFAALAEAGALAAMLVDSQPSGLEAGEEPKVTGATTQEIMASSMERVADLHELIYAEERKIVQFLELVHTWFTNPDVRKQVELELPDEYTNLDDASYRRITEEFQHT